MRKLLMGLALVGAVFMFQGCDSSDYLTDEQKVQLLSEIYPDIFDSIKGDDGDSAYQVAVDNGFEGTVEEWLQSLVGADGTDGVDGVCPDCNVTEPEECPNPFELDDNDTDVHMAVWHQRGDLSEYTFFKVLVVDGYPQTVDTQTPTDVLPFILQEDENTTFLYGVYPQEDNVTEDKAIGLQFSQTAEEPDL